jgi:AraC family transcriptional regulator of arabinose operon
MYSAKASVVTTEAASEMTDLSPSRLQHLFKQETGGSIGAYTKEIQLMMVREFLLHSRYSLKHIGQAVGISDVANLGRYFKRRFSYTPASYRRRFCLAFLTKNSRLNLL